MLTALAIAAVHTQNLISAGLNALHRFLIGCNSGQAAPEYGKRSDRSSSAAAWPSESADSDCWTVTRAMWLIMNGARAVQDGGPVKPSFRLGSSFAAWR